MPIVELDIGGTPTRVQVSDGYTPDDLDHIATSLSGGSPWERAGGYLMHQARQFAESGQNVLGDIMGAQFPGQRSNWERAADVATVAGPVAQIVSGPVGAATLVGGLGAGAATRAAGGSEEAADLANLATQVVSGLGAAAIGAGKAVRGAPAALKAASQAKYAEAAAGAPARTISLGTPGGNAFAQDLSDAIDWAGTHPIEAKMARPLLDKLTAPGSTGIDYADLDNALGGLNKIKKQSLVRGMISDAADELLAGTPAGKARLAGKALYRSLKERPFQMGGGLALGVAGGQTAAQQFGRGEYRRGFETLAMTGLASQGLAKLTGRGLLAAGRGAAGPLARTAVAVGGPTIRALEPGAEEPALPADVEEPGPADATPPETAPSRPPANIPAGPYGRELAAVSSVVGVPAELIRAHMKLESGGNPRAVGDQGRSIGLMQIQPGTFAVVADHASALLGRPANIHDPLDNLLAGGLLLRRYLDKTNGDWHAAAQMYNGGEGTTGNAHTRWYADTIGQNLLAAK